MTRVSQDQMTLASFDGVLVTTRSKKFYAEVIQVIESRLQYFSIPKSMEYVTHQDRVGLEAYVDQVSAPGTFSIFFEFEQDSSMRLAGIPVVSEFYPVRVCVSQRDGEMVAVFEDAAV